MRASRSPLTRAAVLLLACCCSASHAASYTPPAGAPGPAARSSFPSYAPHPAKEIDAMETAPADRRDELCRAYCSAELGWKADQFTRSSIHDFFQTPEKVDLRCDFSETTSDIGGAEQHFGEWIHSLCQKRGARNCYWSINYARKHAGRLACVRQVFVK